MGLNEDCQLLIFEKLDLSTLMSVAETNGHLSNLVTYSVKQRFAKKLVNINIRNVVGEIGDHTNETDHQILIEESTIAQKVLEKFGHLIKRLRFKWGILRDFGIEEIRERINSFCSNGLVEFHEVVGHRFKHTFDVYTNTFPSVEVVTLSGRYTRLNSKKQKFNELFPAIQNLTFDWVDMTAAMEWAYFKYPQLKHLYIRTWSSYQKDIHNEIIADKLFKKNPQIEDLDVEYATPKFLKSVADDLPHLRKLAIDRFLRGVSSIGRTDELRFKNVHVFKVQMGETIEPLPMAIPSNIHFDDNLEEFVIDSHPHDLRWIEFIEKYPNLKKLRVTNHLSDAGVQRLIQMQRKFVEISLKCSQSVQTNNVVLLIDTSNSLMNVELTFEIESHASQALDALKKKFSNNEWDFDFSGYRILMERKN